MLLYATSTNRLETDKETFFNAFPPQKNVKASSDGRARHRNRSGGVELVGREPLIFAKVENGVTISCQNFRRKDRKNEILAPESFHLYF